MSPSKGNYLVFFSNVKPTLDENSQGNETIMGKEQHKNGFPNVLLIGETRVALHRSEGWRNV